eukprot:439617_1
MPDQHSTWTDVDTTGTYDDALSGLNITIAKVLAVFYLCIHLVHGQCDYYNAELIPKQWKVWADDLTLAENMEISFDLTIHNNWTCISDQFCHILQIGIGEYQFPRLPLILFNNPAWHPVYEPSWLRVRYSDAKNEQTGYYVYDEDVRQTVHDGDTHRWHFKFTQTEKLFTVDGVIVHNSTGDYDSSQYFGDLYTLWVTNENLNHPPADVLNATFNDFCVYTYTPAPTAAPTRAPSQPPTAPPTQSPTDNPTNVPSVSPSNMPTFSPSNAPTVAPSIPPTNAPSAVPTRAPSHDPAVAPSIAPSIAPTHAPSSAPSSPPTIAPSMAPTTCYEGNVFTNDGFEESIHNKILTLEFKNKVTDAGKIMVANDQIQHLNEEIAHFTNDITQEMQCIASGSCLGSYITFRDNTYCNLLCNDVISCHDAIVNVTNCQSTEIICNGSNSCDSMSIEVRSDAANDYNLSIHCGTTSSCSNIMIGIDGQIHSDINCIGLNACDGAIITVDAAIYKRNTLNMLSYSESVTFANGFGYEEEDASQQYINCNQREQFIKYN